MIKIILAFSLILAILILPKDTCIAFFIPLLPTSKVIGTEETSFQLEYIVGEINYQKRITYKTYSYPFISYGPIENLSIHDAVFLVEYRIGLGDKIDLGIQSNMLYWLGAGIRYQFRKNPSLSLDFNYLGNLVWGSNKSLSLICSKTIVENWELTAGIRYGSTQKEYALEMLNYDYMDLFFTPFIRANRKYDIILGLNYRLFLQNETINSKNYYYKYDNFVSFVTSIKWYTQEKENEVYWYKATEYMNSELYSDAINYFKKIIKLNPQDAQAYEEIGNCYYNKGMKIQAFENYQKSLELNPNNAKLKNWIEQITEKNIKK